MKAISVRQPWAWAIIHAGKDVENRSPDTIARWKSLVGQRIAIHASSLMPLRQWEEVAKFMNGLGVTPPQPNQLERGAIIGFVDVVDTVKSSKSKWFEKGLHGLLFANPKPISKVFVCRGNSSIFNAPDGIERYAGTGKTDSASIGSVNPP